MFAWLITLRGYILKPNPKRKWGTYKIQPKFNAEFDGYGQEDFDSIRDFLTRPEIIEQANKEMRKVRNYIKTWIKKGEVLRPVPESESTAPTPTPRATSANAVDPSLLSIQKQAKDIESNMKTKLESILKPNISVDLPSNLQKLETAIEDIRSTVKEQLDGLHKHINATSKKSVKIKLGDKFSKQKDRPKATAGAGDPDEPSDSENDDDDQSAVGDKKEHDDDEYKIPDLSHLPRNTLKKDR
jgi:hypothetical protein